MTKRVVSGVVAVIVLVALLYLGGLFIDAAVFGFIQLGLFEMYRALRAKGEKPLRVAGHIAATAMFAAWLFGSFEGLMTVLCIGAIGVLVVPVFNQKYHAMDAMMTVCTLVYPTLPLLFISVVNRTMPDPVSTVVLALACIGAFGTDTFCFLVGKACGKHKLCPAISPKKTIEGAVGGVVGATGLMIAAGAVLNATMGRTLPLWLFAALGLVCAVVAQCGDLTASSIKRMCGVKDFGKLIPGHGGVLDRLDSLMFTVVAVFAAFFWLVVAK